jgi:hypothetical protein
MPAERLLDGVESTEHHAEHRELVAGELCEQYQPQAECAARTQIASRDPYYACSGARRAGSRAETAL